MRVIDLFRMWDTNEDGLISRAEFHKAMPLLGLGAYVAEEVDALFNQFDVDGGGQITFRELFRMVRHNPELAPKKKRAAKVEKIELVADLEELRSSTTRAVFKKGNAQWSNEGPQNVRAQLEKVSTSLSRQVTMGS